MESVQTYLDEARVWGRHRMVAARIDLPLRGEVSWLKSRFGGQSGDCR